jgi:hypothetical protein
MAHLFAHEGDTITISGDDYEVITGEFSRDMPENYTLKLKELICTACKVNPCDGKEGFDQFCPRCIEQAMRWAYVVDAVQETVPVNVQTVVAEDIRQEALARRNSHQYINLRDSAADMLGAESKEEAAVQVDDVLDVVKVRIAEMIHGV